MKVVERVLFACLPFFAFSTFLKSEQLVVVELLVVKNPLYYLWRRRVRLTCSDVQISIRANNRCILNILPFFIHVYIYISSVFVVHAASYLLAYYSHYWHG